MGYLMVLLAYCIGGVPFGLLIGRRYGVDIRDVGSGNIGATNVWRNCGPRAGALALALDVAKGLAPTLLAKLLLPDLPVLHVLCAAGAVLGHTFSPYIGFKGGKAVGTSLGCCLALAPSAAAIGFGVFLAVLAISRYVSLGSLLGTLAAAIAGWLLGYPVIYSVIVTGGVTLIWLRHRANIQRLLAGTESRFSFGGGKARNEEGEA